MKRSTLLRPDKTGKAIVTILRHVGRMTEVSFGVPACTVSGQYHIAEVTI